MKTNSIYQTQNIADFFWSIPQSLIFFIKNKISTLLMENTVRKKAVYRGQDNEAVLESIMQSHSFYQIQDVDAIFGEYRVK